MLLLLARPLTAEEARLTTTSGVQWRGSLKLENDRLVIVQAGEHPERPFTLAEILEVVFKKEPNRPAVVLPVLEEAVGKQDLPPGWALRDIGQVPKPGTGYYRITRSGAAAYGSFSLRGYGGNLDGSRDCCLFLHQAWRGNLSCSARISSLSGAETKAMAGLMFRAGNEADDAFVACLATAKGGLALLWRASKAGAISRAALPAGQSPAWVRLERVGNRFTALRSKEGWGWEPLESCEVELPDAILAGAVVVSGKEGAVTYAQFSDLQLVSLPKDDGPEMVMLIEGATLSARLLPSQAPFIRLAIRDKTFSLHADAVARLWFTHPSPELESRLKPGTRGFLTREGEFVEGSLLEIEAGRIKFKTARGTVTNRMGLDLLAVALRELDIKPANFEARTDAGEAVYATEAALSREGLSLKIEGLGALDFPLASLATLRRLGDVGWPSAGPAPGLPPARIQTQAGQTFIGGLRIEDGHLVIEADNRPAARLALPEIKEIAIIGGDGRLGAGSLAAAWIGQDLGVVNWRGSHHFNERALTIQSGGEDILKSRDSFYFVWQQLEASGEIIARVKRMSAPNEWAKAGLMIRDRLNASARNVFVAVTPGKGVIWQRRPVAGDLTEQTLRPGVTAPLWLKLAREGSRFSAAWSADGVKWNVLGSTIMEMQEKTLFGFAATSRHPRELSEAVFDEISVRSLSVVDCKPTLVLRNGTEITGTALSGSESAFKLRRNQSEELAVSTLNVAGVRFQPPTTEMAASLKAGRAGLLLRNGDFVDGEFKNLERDHVKIGSLLFGLRAYKVGAEAAALVLHDLSSTPEAFELLLRDGSRVMAAEVHLRGQQVVARDPFLGELAFDLAQLVFFRRGD